MIICSLIHFEGNYIFFSFMARKLYIPILLSLDTRFTNSASGNTDMYLSTMLTTDGENLKKDKKIQ